MDEHSDLEAMAQLAADDADQQLSKRIRDHAKKERRGRITRRILRWTFFACVAAFCLLAYLEPEHRIIVRYVFPITILVGFVSGGMLLLTGGLYPDRLGSVLTQQEKATIDNRLVRDQVVLAEETGVADISHETKDTSPSEEVLPANQFQFEGLPEPGTDSAVSRHIESRKRYSRTASGAVAAVVIYALWEVLTR